MCRVVLGSAGDARSLHSAFPSACAEENAPVEMTMHSMTMCSMTICSMTMGSMTMGSMKIGRGKRSRGEGS